MTDPLTFFPVTWSKPYCGLTYSNRVENNGIRRYCSISDHIDFCILKLWIINTGFSPLAYYFSSIDDARRQAEAWLKNPLLFPNDCKTADCQL